MNNKWLVAITITSLFLNILVVLFGMSSSVIGQGSLITVPTLPKGQGYELVIPSEKVLTCVQLEAQLGLKRGDIQAIKQDGLGNTTIIFNKDIALTSTQVQTATDTVKGLIPNITAK